MSTMHLPAIVCIKKAISHEEALKIIQEERGAHFDPVITEVFVSISDSIREISKQKR